jgi:F0F1-type ATP synthase delta subunit
MVKASRSKIARAFVGLLDKQPAHKAIKALAQEIVDRKLSKDIDLLLNDISAELLRSRGQLDAEVFATHKLSETVLGEIKSILRKETGATSVHLHQQIEPKLHGGVIARTPELELDLSIARKLKQLEI